MASQLSHARRNGVPARRRALKILMGGKCQRCNERRLWKLEFHHTAPRTWVACRVNQWTRLALYVRDYADGNLELLCKACNQAAGVPSGDCCDPF